MKSETLMKGSVDFVVEVGRGSLMISGAFMRIGMTGGIACGKSTASKLFEKAGFGRIDCDEVVHELLAGDGATIGEIEGRFGTEVLGADGTVDRKRLGAKVFGHPSELQALEEILHPRVRVRWESVVEGDPSRNWVIEIPLLFEKNLENRVDLTVCVFCNVGKQAVRLEQRGISEAQAKARIGRQLPLAVKAERADFILLNDGSLPFLESQVERLISQLKLSI